MANVFLAETSGKGGFRKLVVLKVLKSLLARDAESREAFRREADLAARLTHRNIVQAIDVVDTDAHTVLVLEYLDGQTLSRVRRDVGSALPLAVHGHVLTELLAGLAYFHDAEDVDGTRLNPVHRDVSPQNVFITYEGVVKLLDFGIARSRLGDEATAAGVVKGKLHYMSPEQLTGAPTDCRTDLFAVGIMLWEAAHGARFWEGQDDSQLVAALTTGAIPLSRDAAPALPGADVLKPVWRKALAVDPDARYQTATAMRRALRDALGSLEPEERAEALVEVLARQYRDDRSEQRQWLTQLRSGPADDDAGRVPLDSLPPGATAPASLQTMTPGSRSSTGSDDEPTRIESPQGDRSESRSILGKRAFWGAVAVAVVGLAGVGVILARPAPSPRAPAPGPTLPPAPCRSPLELANFESGRAETCAAPGRPGGPVNVYSDGTGPVTPTVGPFGQATKLPEPRGESRFGLRFAGKSLADWGAGLALKLTDAGSFDASKHEGIVVWLRAESPMNVDVRLATAETIDVSYGGTCRPRASRICDDHFSARRKVSSFWTRVRVPFSQFEQLGFGVKARFVPEHLQEIHIAIPREDARTGFAVWVDDVTLY